MWGGGGEEVGRIWSVVGASVCVGGEGSAVVRLVGRYYFYRLVLNFLMHLACWRKQLAWFLSSTPACRTHMFYHIFHSCHVTSSMGPLCRQWLKTMVMDKRVGHFLAKHGFCLFLEQSSMQQLQC